MSSFYRYIRPTQFNEKRLEVETSPHGGVCLRFNENQDGTLWFSFARCHEKDLFSKAVAKSIADFRADMMRMAWANGRLSSLTFTKDTNNLIEQVVQFCKDVHFQNIDIDVPFPEDVAWMTYLEQELHELGSVLQSIVNQNTKTMERATIWYDGIAAANHKDHYEHS